MAQAKKKQSTKTAKKTTTKKTAQKSTRCTKCACSNRDRNHIYLITALGLVIAILLCAGVAIMIV